MNQCPRLALEQEDGWTVPLCGSTGMWAFVGKAWFHVPVCNIYGFISIIDARKVIETGEYTYVCAKHLCAPH